MNSALNSEQVDKIAQLARLQLSDAEREAYTGQLQNIIELVEQMNSVDTSQIEPLAHPLDATQPMRADVITESDQRSELMANAPAQEAGLFLVPRVIE